MRRPATPRALGPLAVVAALATSCGSLLGSAGQAEPPTDATDIGTIEYIIDGDTVDVIVQGVEERVRLIGIDTPEKRGGFRDPECFGDEATAYMQTLLPEGTTVRLEIDAEPRDDFGRLLAYLHRTDDDLFVNLHMVTSGHADTLRIPPNTTFAGEFSAAADAARDAGLGLWGACGNADVPLE